jgi:hypothetical protein
MSSGQYSVYIPTIHNSYTEQSVRAFFELNHTGEVVRVDFAPLKHDEKKPYRHAFVHFNPLSRTNMIMKTIEEEGSYRFYPYETNTRMKTQISEKQQNEYWIFLKNKAPVAETEQNIHQVSHNVKLLEERLEKMEQMEEKMAQMEKKIERFQRMEERFEKMEQKMEQMEHKMSNLIRLNDTFAKVIEIQSINIQSLSGIISTKEESVKVEPEIPLTNAGLEAIETQIHNVKTECDEKYWQVYDKFEEQMEQYSKDATWLFNCASKEIEKLAEKNGKTVRDIQYCVERVDSAMFSCRHAEEKDNRIMDVVYYLLVQLAGKEVADAKFDFMKFNYVDRSVAPLKNKELL